MNWLLRLIHFKSVTDLITGNIETLLVTAFFIFMLGCRIVTGHWLPRGETKGGIVCPGCGAVNSEGICCIKCGHAI